jgi:2-oxo-3-hexenedioate decarboxylase/2-keto-4-pentenoate hydratase
VLAARELARLRVSAERLECLSLEIAPRDEVEAYRAQGALGALLTAQGLGAHAGYKIGCTTAVMQQYLGIDTPCGGQVFANRLRVIEGQFSPLGDKRLGVECEIAVRMGADVTAPVRRSELAASISSYHASIEVVEDRYVDYHSLDRWTLIADDFFHHGLVLGAPVRDLSARHLASVIGRMSIDDQEVGWGTGSDVMEDPLDALAWLVASLTDRGSRLRAGDVVSLGSLVQTHWVMPGQTVVVENDRLGTVSARFTRS